MGKLLIFLCVIASVYFIFFRKKIENKSQNTKNDDSSFELIECEKCKTYVAKNEAIIKDSKHYCSTKCLES